MLLAAACLSQHTNENSNENSNDVDTIDEESYEVATRRIKLPFDNINEIRSRQHYDYVIEHYWDDFAFEAEDATDIYDIDELNAAFAQYVMIIPSQQADSLLRSLIHRAESSLAALDMFAEAAHTVLYDPNSPARNDEYYIPILEELAKSPLYDEYDKMIPQHTLHIVKQNRVRSVANNFRYTLADGTQHSLHSIKADYTILLFNNPGCETCREVIDQIEHSEKLKELSAKYSIVTLAIYPDEDIEAWHDYLPSMPKGWICGYDQGMVLTNNKLYDLKAIPSLYLLDRAKHVLVKDGMSIEQVEQIISQGIQL